MTKREIMVRAHELARTMKGDYSARLALGLQQAWFEARLLDMGGNLWEKAGHSRIYLNNLAHLYGLEISRYNTGNISHATLDGEKISNNSARKILGSLYDAKVWFDRTNGTFGTRGLTDEAYERIMTALGVDVDEEAA